MSLTHVLASLLACLISQAPAATSETVDAAASVTLPGLTTEMMDKVEALRGWNFRKPVPSHLCGEKELQDFFDRSMNEEDAADHMAKNEAAVKLVGLVPEDCNVRDTAQHMFSGAAAFYDEKSKEVSVLQREGAELGSFMQRVCLLHELTHAIDDQYLDFDRLHKAGEASSDMEFVVGALLEGSAIVMQTCYIRQEGSSGKHDPALLQQEMAKEMDEQKAFFEAPPYFTTFSARFPTGSGFLIRGAGVSPMSDEAPAAGGRAPLKAAADLPRSSEQILHADKYWDAHQRDEPVVINDATVEKVLRDLGFSVQHRDTFGELLCAVLTDPADRTVSPMAMMFPGYWTNDAARGWGGDRFFLLSGQSAKEKKDTADRPSGVWFTMWDTPNDAEEFAAAYARCRELPSRTRLHLNDRCDVWTFNITETDRTRLAERWQASPPSFERGGQPWPSR